MIYISGDANDTYVASAFAKAESIPAGYQQFGILVNFMTNDWQPVTSCYFEFNSYSTEWQKVAGVAKATGEYDFMQVFLLYYENCNTVYFDNVQLTKDVFGNTYTYDEDGNLISVTDLEGKEESTAQYDSNNQLIQQTSITGSTIEYEYDPDIPTQLRSATAGGVTVSYEYDNKGNPTKVTTAESGNGYNETYTESSATYTNGSNYMSGITDERGNTTSYTYNEDR